MIKPKQWVQFSSKSPWRLRSNGHWRRRLGGGQIHFIARLCTAAGGGNAELLKQLGISQPTQQLRPLHMVLAKGPALKPLYAHCLGGGPKPRVTVTTHPAAMGMSHPIMVNKWLTP